MRNAKERKKNYFEFRHKLQDGVIKDVYVYSNPILIDNVEYLLSDVHDVTDRKKAEQAMRISEKK